MMRNGSDSTPSTDMAKGSSYKWWALAVICIGTFTSTLDNSIVNVAIPTLRNFFAVDETISVWVYLAYMLTVAGLTLTFGQVGDRIGRKRVYVIGLIFTILGLALNSIAPSMATLIGFRVVQAIGAGMMIAVGPAIITNVFPDEERGKAMGIYVASVGLGLTLGPFLGGVLVDTMGWQSIFYVRLPIVILVLLLSLRLLAEQKAGTTYHSFDKWGSVTLFVGMFALLLALNQSGKQGWDSALVLTSIIAAAILLPLFVIIEGRVKQPLLDLKLFRSFSFSMANLSLLLSFIARISSIFLMPFFLQDGLGYSAFKTGLVQITVPAAMLFVSPFAGRLSDKIGSRALTSAGSVLLGLSLLLLSSMHADSSTLVVVLYLTVMGLGIGLYESPNNSQIMGLVSVEKRGIASAMLATSRGVGLTLGLAIVSSIYAARKELLLTQSTAEAAVIGSFGHTILIISFLCIGVFITSLLAGNIKRQT